MAPGGRINDARSEAARPAGPASSAAGVVDVGKSDELARLRTQTRELLAANQRLTNERDFLKKAAACFAAPSGDGLK